MQPEEEDEMGRGSVENFPNPWLHLDQQGLVSSLILQPPLAKGAKEPKVNCRQGNGMLSIMVKAIVAL
ncbi:Immediate early response 2 protein-like [Crotalus adamanteus]|uniref:Immediate early response 2 protein-like n=1 Tax=Crotalus adamanteus TaxID=8729 RepID=A0AAW1CC94_CROAD